MCSNNDLLEKALNLNNRHILHKFRDVLAVLKSNGKGTAGMCNFLKRETNLNINYYQVQCYLQKYPLTEKEINSAINLAISELDANHEKKI